MLNQSNLNFLRGKILELKNALLFSQNTSLLRIATSIVFILKVDDLGQIWFFISRPRQALDEFDREFPVKLEFFRKGKKFFLHILGKAFIVTDPEEINSLVYEEIKESVADHMVLIKVKMTKADYFESSVPADHAGWWRELRKHVHAWLSPRLPYGQVAGGIIIE